MKDVDLCLQEEGRRKEKGERRRVGDNGALDGVIEAWALYGTLDRDVDSLGGQQIW